MGFNTGGENLDKILRAILPQYECIADAPRSVFDCKGADGLRGALLDNFEAAARKREVGKKYKCIDKDSGVFLIPNPWIAQRVYQGQALRGMALARPEFVMSTADAVAQAKARSVSVIAGGNTGSNSKSDW